MLNLSAEVEAEEVAVVEWVEAVEVAVGEDEAVMAEVVGEAEDMEDTMEVGVVVAVMDILGGVGVCLL